MDNITTQDIEKIKKALPNVERISDMLGKIDGNFVTREELIKIFGVYNNLLKDMRILIEKSIENESDTMKGKMSEHEKCMSDIEKNIDKLKNGEKLSNSKIDSLKKELISLIESEIEDLEDEMPEEADFTEVYDYIDNALNEVEVFLTKQIKKEVQPEFIRDSLERLRGNERLDKSAIKGLDEEFKKLEGRNNNTGVIFGSKKTQWLQTTVAGTIDGINKTFTFEGKVPAQYSERLFLNYIEQNPLTDYVIAGRTITYTNAPDISLSGSPHIIRYAY